MRHIFHSPERAVSGAGINTALSGLTIQLAIVPRVPASPSPWAAGTSPLRGWVSITCSRKSNTLRPPGAIRNGNRILSRGATEYSQPKVERSVTLGTRRIFNSQSPGGTEYIALSGLIIFFAFLTQGSGFAFTLGCGYCATPWLGTITSPHS